MCDACNEQFYLDTWGDETPELITRARPAEERPMHYTVTYYRALDTTMDAEYDTMIALDTEEVALEEVIENCQLLGCNAALYDAAGFAKGWVHADGTYQLS